MANFDVSKIEMFKCLMNSGALILRGFCAVACLGLEAAYFQRVKYTISYLRVIQNLFKATEPAGHLLFTEQNDFLIPGSGDFRPANFKFFGGPAALG
jgi:hypothetical protein